MGNKKNRAPRRKNPRAKFILNRKRASSERRALLKEANEVCLDFVSVLRPTPDIKIEYNNEALDPIATTAENGIEHSQYVESVHMNFDEQSANEIPHIEDKDKFTVDIVSRSNKNIAYRKHEIVAFENKCRLCTTEEESNWIDVFSSEPYEDCDEITPSNILEIIEQFTTVKISEDDRLPHKLCTTCFQSMKFMCNFRAKSLRSKETLDLALTKHDQQKKTKPSIQVLTANRVRNKRIKDGLQCDTCGDVFEKLNALQWHLNRHSGTKPFVCTVPYCERSFYSEPNLKTHILRVHPIEPKYKCDVEKCNKVFTTSYKLKIHRTSHFLPTIPCTICGKLLRSQATVIKHRRSHTERRFKCNECGKSFQTAYTLQTHRRIHTNEKPYICCKCAEPFAYNCLLKAHTEKYHPS